MLFNSLQFAVFFPVVVALYLLLPARHRWGWLLAASYYFYMCWKPEYVILIWISTAVDYVAAIRMSESEGQHRRRAWLLVSLVSNLGLLFGFKYWNFFSDSTRAVFEAFDVFVDVPEFDVLLPVGISFYTFQTLSYTIEVYRGNQEPERHLGIFALYVAFFPQLVAGPIERSTRLLPQLRRLQPFDAERISDGLRLMLWGFFQKLVIADRAAVAVNHVYNDVGAHDTAEHLLATYLFAIQIYCDFSGYTDIARGAARVFGVELMRNFERPYFATSVSDFWRRWHISLSTWFRDYLYIPLGGNRVSPLMWRRNLMIVFVVSGLWHGAAWTFVLWGALHGAFLVLGTFRDALVARLGWTREPGKVRKGLQMLLTFHLVVLAWVFFRANSVDDAFLVIRSFFVWSGDLDLDLGLARTELLVAALGVACLLVANVVEERGTSLRTWTARLDRPARWAFAYVLGGAVLLLGYTGAGADFIYFQF